MGKYAVLYTVHFYEKETDDKYVLKHCNGLMFADNFSHAARLIEEEYPEAEKIDIQIYDNCIIIPDDKMEVMKEILEY